MKNSLDFHQKIIQKMNTFIIMIVISNLIVGFLILYANCSIRRKSTEDNITKTKLIYKDPLKNRNGFFS